MNKLLALLFLLGAVRIPMKSVSALGLSLRDCDRMVQEHTPYGTPAGEPYQVPVNRAAKTRFVVLGMIFTMACFYFAARSRRDDLRRIPTMESFIFLLRSLRKSSKSPCRSVETK